MGILRTDRVSGLGGANAIKGSVFFGTSDLAANYKNLAITNTSDLDIGDGNYTIEYWFNCADSTHDKFNTSIALSEYTNGSSNTAFNLYHYNKGFRIFNRTGGGFTDLVNESDKWIAGKWHHFAWVRSGTGSNENAIYVDGVSIDTFTNDANYTSGQHWLIGANFYTGSDGYGVNPEYGFSGHLSNVRVSNVARYSGAFTPPTSEYVVDSNTILLACQSPGDILQEATGKEITYYVGNAFATSEGSGNYFLNSPPQASRFTPNSPVGFSTTTDVGTQFGSTFDGVTTFDSQAYMVVPGGNTRERNRGRGVYNSGHSPAGSITNDIEFMEIQSQGNAIFFGDLTSARRFPGASSSSTRGVFGSGLSTNVMDFITIATTANATDFGDMTRHGFSSSGTSDGLRGVYAGGYQQPQSAFVNNIDFITFATAGNAQDFGDTSVPACHMAGGSSRTRGVYMGMSTPSPNPRNIIEFVTIQSAGNTTDFGDCSVPRGEAAGASNSTRMIAAGGDAPDTNTEVNLIEFITMASTGNATDFGDLTVVRSRLAGLSNSTRGVFLKGHVLPAGTVYNTADFVNIASTGNAIDFGDGFTGAYECSGCSDSHGGLEG